MSTSLIEQQQQELQRFRSGRFGWLKLALLSGVCLAIVGLLVLAIEDSSHRAQSRDELLATQIYLAEELVVQSDSLRSWIVAHGTMLELSIFDGLSSLAFSSAAVALRGAESDTSFITRVFLSLHGAGLRVSFFVLASMRLWIVAIVGAAIWSHLSMRDHKGADLLGASGIGRLFYSGIRGDLDRTDSKGAPLTMIPGLACPARTSLAAARASRIGEVLRKFDAMNEVNAALTAIINASPRTPGYVATRDEQAALENFVAVRSLPITAEEVLRQMLSLHLIYRLSSSSEALLPVARMAAPDSPLSTELYVAELQRACHRALTESLRAEIAKLPPTVLATLVLAEEAGKVLAYTKEAGRWFRRSSFPELASRAVLHSIASLSSVYDPTTRQQIRQALVYGARQSIFAPVQFPLNMTDTVRALRQWSELLMTSPHHLARVAPEIEFLGIATEAHRAWRDLFFESITTGAREVVGGILATQEHLLFVPVKTALALMRRVVTRPTAVRVEELLTQITTNQQQSTSLAGDEESVRPRGVHALKRLSSSEVKELAELHGLNEAEIREWSAFRAIFTSYGWLATRVGDYAVPLSGITYGIFRAERGTLPLNAKGYFARKGLVALRAARLKQQWGKGWNTRFHHIEVCGVAADEKAAAKMLDGIFERTPDEEITKVAQGGQS